jgi:adenylate cyclase
LNWFPEHDQIVRKVPMLVRLGGNLAPSLVAEAIRLSAGGTTISVRSSTASGETPFVGETGITSVRIGRHLVPTVKEARCGSPSARTIRAASTRP